MPFLLHAGTVFCTGAVLKIWGKNALPIGIVLATIVHSIYNLYLLRGWVC